jgi:hypothetical protein
MKSIKIVLFFAIAFAFQMSYSQGCESPGEGDGIKIFGFIQPQYEHTYTGVNGNRTSSLDSNGYFFNRARLGVMGNIPYDFSYYFIMEFAPVAGFGICDAFVSYDRYGSYFKAAVGQFKSPFGAEQVQGCHKLYTIDRSEVVNQLAGPIRDMGITIFGGSGEKIKIGEGIKDVVTYQFAIMNGEGRDVIGDDIEYKPLNDNYMTYISRLTFTPIKYLTIGGSYQTGKFTPVSTTATKADTRTRFGFDALLKYKNFTLQGEYIQGTDEGSYTTGGGCGGEVTTVEGSVDRSGYYLTALYKTKWKLEPVLKFETYDPDNSISGNTAMRWTPGINYFFNEWTRLQVNYQYNFANSDIPYGVPYEDVLQIQMQIIIK